MNDGGVVGVIANPASGKDIRRLIAHGSTFDNNEKINIVRRVLLGLDALGARRVLYMPDLYGIVPRAAASIMLRLDLLPLPMPVLGNGSDTFEAAQRLADLGASCLVTLGGDGTNRLVAKGCGDVPLVPISTGTNNVFPRLIEGTIAGMAAGLVANGEAAAIDRRPRLDVIVNDEQRDVALIDVVVSRQAWVGARAIWDPTQLAEIVLSRVAPAEIGMCGLGGLLFPHATGTPHGVHVLLGSNGEKETRVLAPVAPGLLRVVSIAEARLLTYGETVMLRETAGTVALDGEREFELRRLDHSLQVTLNPSGPRVVDVDATIRAGAERGVFQRQAADVLAEGITS